MVGPWSSPFTAVNVAVVLVIALAGCAKVATRSVPEPSAVGTTSVATPSALPSASRELTASAAASRALTCGGGLSFQAAVLDGPPTADTLDDPAAAELRRHASDPAFLLPRSGWREVVRQESLRLYVSEESSFGRWSVSVEEVGGTWEVTGWGSCTLMVDVGEGLAQAEFRVDPAIHLEPSLTEIPVLVTERACNSGDDAFGRVADPIIEMGPDEVIVIFAVRPRRGAHTCPSNPETPHLLVLPEPLGDRVLLDGTMVPPRDATTCPLVAACR